VGLWQIQPQIMLLMASLIIGLVTGLLFDIYRRIRNLVSPGPYLTALGDLCFWCLISVITFTSLLAISSGQVRGYVFIGIAAGLAFYIHFISRYVIWLFVVLDIYVGICFAKISKFIGKVKRLTPVRLIQRIWQDAQRILSKIRQK
jgi:spore cortex biosynthesis protein YabQ